MSRRGSSRRGAALGLLLLPLAAPPATAQGANANRGLAVVLPAPAPSGPGAASDSGSTRQPASALLDAEVALLDGPVLRQGTRRAAVRIASLAPDTLTGVCRVLPTAAWQVQPARARTFRLAPGEGLQHVFDVSLPRFTSPGVYELVFALEVGGREVGVLHTRLVKPMDWVTIGPLRRPGGAGALAPEQGLNLDARLQGLDGAVGWQHVPDVGFDAAGALQLDLLYAPAAVPQCACAFTVFEAGESRWVRWTAPGVERAYLNGVALRAGHRAWLERGRNTLLARTCSDGGRWRMDFAFQEESGEPALDLDNDLSRFLVGFRGLYGATATGPAHRVVTLRYRNPAAHRVEVLGTFNDWIPAGLKRDARGAWMRDLLLAPGRYAYKLRVDGQLLPDPEARGREPDGFGGQNSVILVK